MAEISLKNDLKFRHFKLASAMAFKQFGDVDIKSHFFIGVHLQRSIGVHIKSEIEEFIRFKSVHLYLYFLEALIYNEMEAYV